MDEDTRQALNRLRDRVENVNQNLNITTDAVGALAEEITAIRESVEESKEQGRVLLQELRFFRKSLQTQINDLNQKIEDGFNDT